MIKKHIKSLEYLVLGLILLLLFSALIWNLKCVSVEVLLSFIFGIAVGAIANIFLANREVFFVRPIMIFIVFGVPFFLLYFGKPAAFSYYISLAALTLFISAAQGTK